MSEGRPGRLLSLPAHAPPAGPLPERLCPAVLDLSVLHDRTRTPAPRALRGPLELYLAQVGAQDERALRRARELLDAEERARARAFLRDRDRDAYVVAHAALRSA